MLKSFYLVLLGLFFSGVFLRLFFSPDMNYETDSFSILLASKSIFETGEYTIPPVSLTDYDGNYQTNPGWAVGYSLLLSILFKIFGYSESIARIATVLVTSSVIPIIGIVGYRLQDRKVGILASILVILSPILLCVNGRILTANMGYSMLTLSISFLILGTIRRKQGVEFISSEELIRSKHHLFFLSLSFLFFGFTLLSRDDFVMFAPVFLISFWRITRHQYEPPFVQRIKNYMLFFGMAVVFALIGFSPNLYFNYKTYGKIFTSSHLEYGGRLRLEYLLEGSSGAMGLPGWAVIVLSIIVFAFPVVSILFIWSKSKAGALLGSMLVLMIIPLLLINGSYPVSSSGASGRYVIPLIPLGSIATAILLNSKDMLHRLYYFGFLACLILWHGILIYPPSIFFQYYPQIAYITHYSPWYNKQNYINYPHPIRTTLQWVSNNTPADSIVLSDYDFYQYFFYANRDVMNRDLLKDVKKRLMKRKVFFVEDHLFIQNPDLLRNWQDKLKENQISLKKRNTFPFFSPNRGDKSLNIYELILSVEST